VFSCVFGEIRSLPCGRLSALVAVDREGGGEVRHFGLDAFEDGLVFRRLE